MKKIILFISVLQITWAMILPKLKVGDWWIVKYSSKASVGASSKIPKDSIIYVESPFYILKFTVTKVDTTNYIINVETPMDLIEKEKTVYIDKYRRYDLYINSDSFLLSKATEFWSDQDSDGRFIYRRHSSYTINNRLNELIWHMYGELFAIPRLSVNRDSFFLPGIEQTELSDSTELPFSSDSSSESSEGLPDRESEFTEKIVRVAPDIEDVEIADWAKPIVQKSKQHTLNFKSKQVNYKIIDLTQARFSVEQIWVDGFPWWLFHKGKKYKAELISSSFYSDEDIKALKELIKNDLEKRKSKEQ